MKRRLARAHSPAAPTTRFREILTTKPGQMLRADNAYPHGEARPELQSLACMINWLTSGFFKSIFSSSASAGLWPFATSFSNRDK